MDAHGEVMKLLFAGLDVGTSGAKIAVYDISGHIVFKAGRQYEESGTDGHRELDPDIVRLAVFEILSDAGRSCSEAISAITFASLGESLVILGKDDAPLMPSMLTGDKRGGYEAEIIKEQLTSQKVMQITGLPPNELYSMAKVMWMNGHTDVLKRADKVFFYEDYFGYLLTGHRMVSHSSASRSQLFDIKRKKWSQELLEFVGLDMSKLSTPVPAGTMIGTIKPSVAESLYLRPETKVIVGGHDQSCVAVGCGVLDTDTCVTSMGTCEFMQMMLPKPVANQYMIKNDFTCIPHAIPGMYLTSLEVTTCGILKNWGRDVLYWKNAGIDARSNEFYDSYIEQRIQGLRTGVLTLPQFGSSGNPNLSMDARGTITGLTIHTKPEEIYLSMLEGMSFQMLLAYERLSKLGVKASRVMAAGGGAASDVTLQMRADIFDMTVCRLSTDEPGTLGCMILAAYGAGAFASIPEAMKSVVHISQEFEPDPRNGAYYMDKYRKYKMLYQHMHSFK